MSMACRADAGNIKSIRTIVQNTERKNTEKRFERFVSVGKIGLNGILTECNMKCRIRCSVRFFKPGIHTW